MNTFLKICEQTKEYYVKIMYLIYFYFNNNYMWGYAGK